jgi:hypothetical protein
LLPKINRGLNLSGLTTNNVITHSLNDRTFTRFNENWEDFLNSLDKFWNLLNAYKEHHIEEIKKEKLKGYLGNINGKRTSDDLLVYLDKARNNSQHTLWRHLRESRPMEVITGHGATITFESNGITVTGEGEAAKEVDVLFKPGIFLLKQVKVIEGKKEIEYDLPVNHLGRPLKPMERVLPQIIGKLGLEFYQNVFIEFKKRI